MTQPDGYPCGGRFSGTAVRAEQDDTPMTFHTGAVMTDLMHTDVIQACADLVGRTGARDFEIGYVHDDVPVEEAGWYAHASFQGARIQVQDHRSPSAAALALAERLLAGGACRCGKPVTLADGHPGCRWRLMGKRWEPSCDVPSVRVDGKRGDLGAMNRAMRRRQR